MCGGGGGGVPPPQDNSLQIEAMREQAARDAADQAVRDKSQATGEFKDELANAMMAGKSIGTNYLASRGLSNDQYGSVIDQILNDTRAKVPTLDSNPAQYFTTDTFASGLNDYQSMKRGNFGGKVSSTFAPGYEDTYIPDTADDQVINDILGTQRNTAQQQVDFQRKRGLLNDAGYTTAQQRLGDQGQAAKSTLDSIGTGVLNKDRANLTDIVANAGNAANSWTLGNADFSVDPYVSKVRSTANQELGNLGGDVKSALGSTQLFDIPSIIAAAGISQGPQNLTTADATPGIPFNKKSPNVNRGLGSTGTF